MMTGGDQGCSGSRSWLGVVPRFLVTLLLLVLLLLLGGCGRSTQSIGPTTTPAMAHLLVEVTPRGSQIYVDGMRSGTTMATLTLPAGQHTIRVEQDGFEPLVEMINVAPDNEYAIRGELVPEAGSSIPTVTGAATGESGSGQPLPDLAITHVQIELETGSSCAYASTALGIRVWLENLGSADAGPFSVEVNGIQQMVVEGLAAGQTVTVWFEGYVNGENTMQADATDQIQEAREENNSLSQRLPVPTLPPTCTPPATRSLATTAPPTAAPAATVPRATQPPTPVPADVTMWEGEVTIRTYPFGSFTSEAWSERFGMAYDVLDQSAYEASNPQPTEVSYRTFVVENEYIRLSFLPDLGGRLYQVLYKPTGHLETYRNPVLKPNRWGPPEQGWWLAAGGFEWCLPVEEHGYEWGEPWKLTASSDGQSVTVLLRDSSAGDRIQAEIAVRLEAGAAAFTIRPRLENPTNAPLEVKYWTNAMLAPGGQNKPTADLLFVLPHSVGEVTVHSRGDEFLPEYNQRMSWPVYEGRNLSRLGHWNRWLGFFEDPATGGFVAIYDRGYDEGMVRVAMADAVAGSKVFAFGWQDPMPWSNWTDDGSSYVELHSGPAPTFDDSVTIPPGGNLQWVETWYPVAGLGGLRCANEFAALNLMAGRGEAHVGVAVPRSWSGDLVLLQSDRELWRQSVWLRPGQPFVSTAELGEAQDTGRILLHLETPDGATLSECSVEPSSE